MVWSVSIFLAMFFFNPLVWAQRESTSFSASDLEKEITQRLSRVEEFAFIREKARALGIRVWLFGGSASSFAHYVDWDLRMGKGDSQYLRDRFDYDYTSIYSSTQDLDLVVDGPWEAAQTLQKTLETYYPHMQGNKKVWEVRLLRKTVDDKEALLHNFHFLGQHSDSHSTGLIEISDPSDGEHPVLDLRDETGHPSRFLKDVHEGKIHFYFSVRHHETNRAKEGLNPPIISVIRILTKAFQFNLEITLEDEQRIRTIIEGYNPRLKQNEYVHNWIERNGKKLFQNAMDVEYAWNTLERLGMRRKLIAIKNNTQEVGSLAWWMTKEPLRSYPLGKLIENDPRLEYFPNLQPSKTARELGLDKVAHETSDFLAYESITRSPIGHPNVFISRQGYPGENAAVGNCFYTLKGTTGAKGTGMTIRFFLHPDAMEGVDFVMKEGGVILVLNKYALTVISESLYWTPVQYFTFMGEGKNFEHADLAIVERLQRKIRNKVPTMPEEEKAVLLEMAKQKLRNKGDSHSLSFIKEFICFMRGHLDKDFVQGAMDWRFRDVDHALMEYVLMDRKWVDNPDRIKLIKKLLLRPWEEMHLAMVRKLVSNNRWREEPELCEIMLDKLHEAQADTVIALMSEFFTLDEIARRPDTLEAVLKLVQKTGRSLNRASDRDALISAELVNRRLFGINEAIAKHLLTHPVYSSHLRRIELLNAVIEYGSDEALKTVRDQVLTHEAWSDLPHSREYLQKIEDYLTDETYFRTDPLGERTEDHVPPEFWRSARGEATLNKLLMKPRNYYLVREKAIDNHLPKILSDPYWARHPKGIEMVLAFVEKARNWDDVVPGILSSVLDSLFQVPEWEQHERAWEILDKVISARDPKNYYGSRGPRERVFDILSKPYWAGHDKSPYLVSKLIPKTQSGIIHLLAAPHWASHPKAAELLKMYFQHPVNLQHDDGKAYPTKYLETQSVVDALLTKPIWQQRKDFVAILEDMVEGCFDPESNPYYYKGVPMGFEHLVEKVLFLEGVADDLDGMKLIEKMAEHPEAHWLIARHLMSKPWWIRKKGSDRIMDILIDGGKADGDLVWHALNQELWASHQRGAEFILRLVRIGKVDSHIDNLLSKEAWSRNFELRKICKDENPSVEKLKKVIQDGYESQKSAESLCLQSWAGL